MDVKKDGKPSKVFVRKTRLSRLVYTGWRAHDALHFRCSGGTIQIVHLGLLS